MHKHLLLISLLNTLLSAGTIHAKSINPKNINYRENYTHSSNRETTEDRVISSTAEASAQITVTVTLQVSTEMTSGREINRASMSFLDNNRIQITENIAEGKGEYLQTLLTLLKIKPTEDTYNNIQNNFETLIYLNHDDFLNQLIFLS